MELQIVTAEQTATMLGQLGGSLAALIINLHARLIKAGIAELEDVIADMERMASTGDPAGIYASVANGLKQMRPWGVIEGGKTKTDD